MTAPKNNCCICVYLNQDGCLSHVQKLFPLQVSSEPALKEDDLTHYVLVQRVLQLLSLQLLQEHLTKESTPEFTCTEGNRSKHRQEMRFIKVYWKNNSQEQ